MDPLSRRDGMFIERRFKEFLFAPRERNLLIPLVAALNIALLWSAVLRVHLTSITFGSAGALGAYRASCDRFLPAVSNTHHLASRFNPMRCMSRTYLCHQILKLCIASQRSPVWIAFKAELVFIPQRDGTCQPFQGLCSHSLQCVN
jgi:hypothetical protein